MTSLYTVASKMILRSVKILVFISLCWSKKTVKLILQFICLKLTIIVIMKRREEVCIDHNMCKQSAILLFKRTNVTTEYIHWLQQW